MHYTGIFRSMPEQWKVNRYRTESTGGGAFPINCDRMERAKLRTLKNRVPCSL